MRKDIAHDPKATHYCKYCGLTMKPKEVLDCPVCDGDLCEAKKRERLSLPKRKVAK